MSIKRKDIWVFQFSTGCHSTTFRGKVPFRLRSTGSLHVATPSEDWGLSGEGRFDIPHIDTHTHTHKFPSFLPASRRSLPLWSERWKDDKSANSPSHTTSLDFLGKSKSRKILRHLIHDMNKLYFRQSSSGDGARSQNPTRKHVTNVTTWNFPHGSSQKENLKSCGVSFLCKERNFSASECLAVRYFLKISGRISIITLNVTFHLFADELVFIKRMFGGKFQSACVTRALGGSGRKLNWFVCWFGRNRFFDYYIWSSLC